MARILGVDLPREKRLEIGLRAIYGMGPTRVKQVLEQTGVSPDVRVKDLSEEEVSKLAGAIQATYKVEGELRREVVGSIKRLMDINCYRGMRHKKGLPVRGQRTKTNARTRKGPRGAAVSRKK